MTACDGDAAEERDAVDDDDDDNKVGAVGAGEVDKDRRMLPRASRAVLFASYEQHLQSLLRFVSFLLRGEFRYQTNRLLPAPFI